MFPGYQIDKLPKTPLNLHQSLFLSQLPGQKGPYKCIIKCYRKERNQEDCLRKLQNSNHNLIIRPLSWKVAQNIVFIALQIQQMSLETFIFLHKVNKDPIMKECMKSFIKIFDTIKKMHKGKLFHGNLKPSNIFIKFPEKYIKSKLNDQEGKWINFEQVDWKVSQVGINQVSQNKYYSKGRISAGNASKSMYMDPYENDFYSLGVILLEMVTLLPIDKIHEDIMNDQIGADYFKKVKLISEIKETSWSSKLLDFIRALLNPKQIPNITNNPNGLNHLYRQYEDSIEYEIIKSKLEYRDYLITGETLQNCFHKQNIVEEVMKSVREKIQKQQMSCSEIFKFINRQIDPEDQFFFSSPKDFFRFFDSLFSFNFQEQIHSLLCALYFTFESHIHYMGILIRLIKKSELASTVIRKAIDKFDSASELFKEQTNGRDVWKAEDLMIFFNTLRVPFTPADIQELLRSWTNNIEKQGSLINSLKLQEFKKIFKEYVSPKKAEKSLNESIKKEKGKKIQDIFNELKEKHNNLVHFFRIMPGENKWQLPLQKVRQEIKKYIKFKNNLEERQFFDQILDLSRVSQNKTTIDYLKLLLKLQLQDAIALFRQVLVERINEDGIENIYKKYEKENKGWNRQSITQFCQRQYLPFDERNQNLFYQTLDKDGDTFIQLKELMFRLTGIKHFDFQNIVNNIKQSTKNQGDKVFNAFLKFDQQISFKLNSLNQLVEVFDQIDSNLKLQPEHYREVYNKFATRKDDKFEYLPFLRYFCSLEEIFMKCCKLIIDSMFRKDFNQFFKIGLKKGKRKWQRQSLTLINEMAILKFKEKQLDELWTIFDLHDDKSLTKQEVAEKFGKQVQALDQFKGRNVESLNDFRPKKDYKNSQERQSLERNPRESFEGKKSQQEEKLQKNELILQLKQMKLQTLLSRCLQKSEKRCSVWIDLETFCDLLKNQALHYGKKFIQNNFPHCIKKSSSSTDFNYLKFMFLVAQFKRQPEKSKAECLIFMLAQFCKQMKFSARNLFDQYKVKDDVMKLSKFQTIVKEILDDELFFEDINDVWQFIGNPKFISSKDLEKILEEEDVEVLRNFLKSSQQKKQKYSGFNSRDQITPELRRQRESDYQGRRKLSSDSLEEKQINYNQKVRQSFGRDQYNRNKDDRQNQNNYEKQKRNNYERQEINRKYDKIEGQRQKNYEEDRRRNADDRRRNTDDRRTKNNQRDSSDSQDRLNRRNRNQTRDQKQTETSFPLQKRRTSQKNLKDRSQRGKEEKLSKKQLIAKFQKKLDENSTQELTSLFMSANKIQKEDFQSCLVRHYSFSKRQAQDFSEQMADFGMIKIETVKKYLKPNSKDRYQREEPERYKKSKQKKADLRPNRKENEDRNYQNEKPLKPEYRLTNPKKLRLNVPLIKQQIKVIIRSFSQQYAIQEIDRYFFDESEVIYRDQFIKKCRAINTTLTEQNIEKIFEFLRPNQKDEVSIISFKISFTSINENVESGVEYLPKDLLKELGQIFTQHDKDNSGSIEIQEIEALLSTLGFNETKKQIQAVFRNIDKSFDNKISFNQFKEFIEEFILPHLFDFDQDMDELFLMLKMNDVFNTGTVTVTVLIVLLEKFGVKLSNQEGLLLAKYIGNQNNQIPIINFIASVYFPNDSQFPPIIKCALYKIKLRRKISLKQIQKTFSNISSNFVMAYTSRLIRSQQLKCSSIHEPQLHQSFMFYQDFFYKDFRKIQSSKNDKLLIQQDPKAQTVIVQIRCPEVVGVPIPQNQTIKSNVLKRSMNVTFFDMSAQMAKNCIIILQADWDSEIEDQWVFDSKNRSFFMKIANYDPKKYEKIILLFELIITMNDNGRTIQVSCGSTSISIKQLASIESKFSKKLKLVSGIPTKAKQIDKVSVTKRTGWKSFLGSSNIQSELSIDIFAQKNIDTQPTLCMIYSLPSICLVKRKSLHYIWTFREYFAQRSVDKDTINPQFLNHHTVRAFLLSLDMQDISSQVFNFWREKIESSVKTVAQARSVFYILLSDLYIIFSSKQFEMKLSNPCSTVISNKNLYNVRQKMILEVFENVENYVKNDLNSNKVYRRTKNYNYTFSSIFVELSGDSLQKIISRSMVKVGRD